jgi:hypothetical protein
MSLTDAAAHSEEAQRAKPARMQDFIFARELAEVLILLDHVSGHSDKRLSAAFGGDDAAKQTIKEICSINWPPSAGEAPQPEDAATLLMAKDRLNQAATPANGDSIAFTILVVGDDEAIARRGASWRQWFRERFPFGPNRLSKPNVPSTLTHVEGDVPSRTLLAQRAYPGLVATAAKFNRRIKWLVFLLFVWLIFTCLLSWNIATGRAILVRLDAAKTTLAATDKRIAEIESGDATKRSPADQNNKRELIQRYCEHAQTLPEAPGTRVQQFETAAQYQICDERRDGLANVEVIRGDLAGWLDTWIWIKGPQKGDEISPNMKFDVWAAIFAEILSTAVLPICYGFLGAGAAVVRNLHGKMRESLLSPRDLTLAWCQLALGAVIGACIGLFVSPTSGGAQGVGLISGASTLSLAALSFIAGFGVESVFVALESLIGRIFNVSPPTPPVRYTVNLTMASTSHSLEPRP